ncbi:M48 family metallopeptidase [Hydrogenophaga atypica]|uniref:M48 family metallopeptidase n=1 Tax=Hydrogenophaga atypica TaxID=249409 RepID=A0ABW2QDI7_9BURK
MKHVEQLSLDLFDEAPVAKAASATHWQHPRASRQLQLGACLVAYEFKRGKRRTIGLSVGPDGLSVSAPRWTPLAEVEALLRDKTRWVLDKLQAVRERQAQAEQARIEWRDGARFPYLGEDVVLCLDPTQGLRSAGAMLEHTPEGARLRLGLPKQASADQMRDMTQAWLMREARALFTQRLDHFAPSLGVRWTKLRLSSAGTRWGSASADGSIRLNWRLIHFGPAVIDYVVAHELSHLREMNHSPQFWDTVASVMPDFEARRQALHKLPVPKW